MKKVTKKKKINKLKELEERLDRLERHYVTHGHVFQIPPHYHVISYSLFRL